MPAKTVSSKSKVVWHTSASARTMPLPPVTTGSSNLNQTPGSLLKKEVPHAPMKGGSKVYRLGTSTTAESLLPRASRTRASKHPSTWLKSGGTVGSGTAVGAGGRVGEGGTKTGGRFGVPGEGGVGRTIVGGDTGCMTGWSEVGVRVVPSGKVGLKVLGTFEDGARVVPSSNVGAGVVGVRPFGPSPVGEGALVFPN